MSKMTATELATSKANTAAMRASVNLTKQQNAEQNRAAFAGSIVQLLDALSAKRDNWERTDFKKANEGLCVLLADCLGLYNAQFVTVDTAHRKALRDGLTVKLKGAGVKVQKNTTTLTMLVRYVFSSDRKRAHGYAYVLMAALAEKVAAADLAAFIAKAGGIEEIKRKMVKSADALAKQALVKQAKSNVAAEIELAQIAPLAEVRIAGLTGDYVVLLAKPGVDGTATIVGTLSNVNEALVNALLDRMAKQRVIVDAENAALAKEAPDMLATTASNDASIKKAA
jgi:hypothetical protein